MAKRVGVGDIREKATAGEPIVMVSATDFPSGQLVDRSGADMILVGDSLGMTALGYDSTVPVTMDEMIHHSKAVVRGAEHALIVGDMPFGAYHESETDAIRNAVRLLKEGGVDVVKMEGGEEVAPKLKAVVDAGIPVMGHIGLTPQLISKLGGFKVQGKNAAAGVQLIRDALAVQEAGCFSVVVEAVPDRIAALITERLTIPTIGIGAGLECDGQILIFHDLIGMFDRFTPKFAKRYAEVGATVLTALEQYRTEVVERQFPTPDHSYTMKDEEYEALVAALDKSGG